MLPLNLADWRIYIPLSTPCPKKVLFFVNAYKNLAPSPATYRSVSLLSAGFPYVICLQRSPKFKHCCLHFEQHSAAWPHFCDVVLSETFCPNSFRSAFQLPLWVMVALKPYYFEQTCSNAQNDSIEETEVDNHSEKIDFADHVKDDKSVAGFLLPANFEVDGMTTHKHSLSAKTV